MKSILLLPSFTGLAQNATRFGVEMARKYHFKVLLYPGYYSRPPQRSYFASEPFARNSASKESADSGSRSTVPLEINRNPRKKSRRYTGAFGAPARKPAEQIAEMVKQNKIWMIVIGERNHRCRTNRLLFGKSSRAVIDKATCPVLLIPETASFEGLSKIGFAADMHDADPKEIAFLFEFVKQFDAELLVTLVRDGHLSDSAQRDSGKRFRRMVDGPKKQKISFREIHEHDLSGTVTLFSNFSELDALTLIHRKHRFPESIIHGSTTRQLTTGCTIPLLVFPPISGK